MTRRLLLLALGLICGYALRRPDCQKIHVEYRHLDPAIVDREDDEGILPPDPRTWRSAPDLRTWPDTLEHDDQAHFGGIAVGCRRCGADRWLRRSGWRS